MEIPDTIPDTGKRSHTVTFLFDNSDMIEMATISRFINEKFECEFFTPGVILVKGYKRE